MIPTAGFLSESLSIGDSKEEVKARLQTKAEEILYEKLISERRWNNDANSQ